MNEDFKRPDHNDFLTSSELKAKEFTGVRHNSLLSLHEFWILGEIVKTVTDATVARDPEALTKAHLEVFALTKDPDSKFQ